MAEGLAEGEAQALRDIASKMKASGMQVEDIAAFTELSLEEIELV